MVNKVARQTKSSLALKNKKDRRSGRKGEEVEEVKKQLEKLEKLVKRYPIKIPLKEAAAFLQMNEEGLKAALMRGNAPFGFAYQKEDGAYRVMVIPTVTFYLWYTNTNAQMVLAQK